MYSGMDLNSILFPPVLYVPDCIKVIPALFIEHLIMITLFLEISALLLRHINLLLQGSMMDILDQIF